MADTQRTRAALLALYADNVTGQISPQDLRDGFVTLMNTDFAYEGDFWKQPDPYFLTKTDKTWKGWADYSQVIDNVSAISAYHVLALQLSGGWAPADAAVSARCRMALGLAVSDYAAGASDAIILRRGIYYAVSFSLYSLSLGKPVYLASGAGSNGSWTMAAPTSTRIIGWFEAQSHLSLGDGTSVTIPVLRFEPEWKVAGS